MIEWSSINIQYWGHCHYQMAEALQTRAWECVRDGHPGFLLGGSVDTVVTQGLRSSPAAILNSSIQPIQTRRGGETTLHSPGQLLIYPVLNLRSLGWGVKPYIENLLQCSTETFHFYQVPAKLCWKPLGLWTEKGKIGFCGVQVRSGITQHGLALNIFNDLTYFDHIVSCGLAKAAYDKATNYSISSFSLEEIFRVWSQNFMKRLQATDLSLLTIKKNEEMKVPERVAVR